MANNEIFKWHMVTGEDGMIDLPRQSDNYLVSTIYGENGNLQTNSYTCYYDANSNTWEAIDSDVVIAWAPIPNPYTGSINLTGIKY